MPSDQQIIKSALDEALWRRCTDILKPLLKEAKAIGVFHWKAALLTALCSKPVPNWMKDESLQLSHRW